MYTFIPGLYQMTGIVSNKIFGRDSSKKLICLFHRQPSKKSPYKKTEYISVSKYTYTTCSAFLNFKCARFQLGQERYHCVNL